jgi:hypothetical protein
LAGYCAQELSTPIQTPIRLQLEEKVAYFITALESLEESKGSSSITLLFIKISLA